MTTIEQRGEWLELLEAEYARRTARVAWEADEGERQRQWFIDTLAAMAQRFAALAPHYPLQIDDMSIAEKLACRYFLPEDLRPTGLATEDQIWAEYRSMREVDEPSSR
jgi:hypothetical protein